MKHFTILTLFPDSLTSYFATSIIKRAQEKKHIRIRMIDLRRWGMGRYKHADDKPYGGGVGMVLMIEPLYKALHAICNRRIKRTQRVILLSAKGKHFTQVDARRLTNYDELICICGRYEGVDERITKFIDEEISIGDYVLTGGELGAAVITDAVARLLPGVLGKDASSKDESFAKIGEVEYPHYTRPEVFITREGKKLHVPKILLSGDHKKIAAWREKKKKFCS
ncbi:MAG: tRNA (guanosine(37)-N1)-methyltransferase TrmD [Parcubacteria group bacterium CG08_land_8_20_14_0_20_48_21]|nr:MAG: tRNA (guanosine(37)-N1)-methyltransferase TrmD [Parcubacteria group bacterium CG2_30_48_51]PIS33179.1 MAG: tRNA (guanosine(37)-N1)-methyltransferase TrmD [Parcubacteria group bacterium CG08_land_8_20_14_0_20_48_21]PIW79422.1 MAG: tRNA (guanosine(37)-N1)-methyltransferase TrmD [Parcubacteria group bacterium CG_4_8_14_3_um_filter_48_16]PIY77683.1 MAG: tRNA (guanosine(37)-N1)-methyltransferase TrmD [Parcubacteria group bacterium CG_4_10_14_0_8_um_filter_48_154]PIZ77459.1 MAG: tRNA (guanosi